jgi:hypothetical protein
MRALSPSERITRLAQSQGRVSVQADCTLEEALVLMVERAEQTQHTLDQVADDIAAHRIWFGRTAS